MGSRQHRPLSRSIRWAYNPRAVDRRTEIRVQALWDQFRTLSDEVAYGLTGIIYASYPPAWTEIAAGLQPDQIPERKPAILVGYQSADEAKAELALSHFDLEQGLFKSPPAEIIPGGRPADLVVALHVHRIMHERDLPDPEETFLAAIQLAENDRFQRARRNLLTGRTICSLTDGSQKTSRRNCTASKRSTVTRPGRKPVALACGG